MANTVIQLKKSATPSVAPSSLAFGELAINYADGILYYKASNGMISSISTGGYSFGTVNANGTLVISDTYSDVLDLVPGQNITITGDAINDRITIGANLTAANNWANTVGNSVNTITSATYATITNLNSNWLVTNAAFAKANAALANTSGVSFAGDLFFPTGNVGIGTTSTNNKLEVIGNSYLNGNVTTGLLKHSPVPISKLLTASDAANNDNFSRVSLSGDASVLAVSSPFWEGTTGTDRGGVYIYDWNGSAWIQRGSVLEAADAADSDSFGYVALSSNGSILAVAAESWEGATGSNRGGVYIYDWNGSAWIQRGSVLEAADAANSDSFGSGVSLSSNGSILAVGARFWEGATGTDRGGVYIYDWNGSAWIQRGSVLQSADAANSDQFGYRVALSSNGSILAVAAPGSVIPNKFYIFDWNGSSWIQRSSTVPFPSGISTFGLDLDISSDGSILAVSANPVLGPNFQPTPDSDNRGVVYIYDWNGSSWIQRGSRLISADASPNDNFYGCSLSDDGSILVVGAEQWEGVTGTGRGAVYTYTLTGALPSYTGESTGSGWIEGSNSSLIARTAGLDRVTIDSNGVVNVAGPTLLVAGQNVLSLISTVGASSNAYSNTVGTAGNNYTNTVGAASNNYASILAANNAIGANNWANTKLANTSGVSFAGNLFFPTGNVGIGTSSPSSKLQVNGTITIANTGPVESFRSGANTITLNMYDEANGTLSWEGSAGQLFSITNDLSGSLFTVNDVSGIPSIEVDALGNVDLAPFGGNVGIGTSNPVYKLDVQGDARITGNLTLGDATTDTITVNAANFNLANNISFDSGTLFIDKNNDRVGVGTTTPSARLHIAKAGTSDEFIIGDLASNYVKMGGIGSGISYIRSFESAFDINNPFTNGVLLFSTAGSERLRITSTGNVGIGTSSPSANLHVVGSVLIYPNSLNATSRLRTRSVHADGRWAIDMNANGTDAKLAQIYSGTIGLGTGSFSSGALDTAIGFADDFAYIPKLRIGGINSGPANISYISITANNTSEWNYGNSYPDGNNYYQIRTSLESGGGAQRAPLLIGAKYLYFATGATDNERMRIDANGSVGINTTSPTHRLHVIGSIAANSGSVRVFSSDGLNDATYGSSSFSFGQTGSFRSTISHQGNESMLFTSYGQNILGLSGLDFTPSVQIMGGKSFGWSSTGSLSNNPNLVFWNETANTFAQRNGTAGQTYRIYGTYTDASNHERLRISANTTGHYIVGEEAGTGLGRPLYLGANNSVAMTIDASSNVGIGTSNPVYKLDVNGDARITGNLTLGDATTDVVTINAANFNLANNVNFDSGTLFIDSQNNKIGIGTTSPTAKLSINGDLSVSGSPISLGDGSTSWTTNSLVFKDHADGQYWGYISKYGLDSTPQNTLELYLPAVNNTSAIRLRTGQAGSIQFWTTEAERMRITSAGNVGIGTSSPTAVLDLHHVLNESRTFLGFGVAGGPGNIATFSYNNADTSFRINLLNRPLIIRGGGDGTVEMVRFTSTGNVGIGTTAPAEKLEVNGNVKANSYIMVNSAMAPITVITATTTDQIVDSFTTSTWRSAQYNITMTAGTDYHTTQISLIHDGTNAYMTEYGTLSTANNLGTFSATVSGSTVRLNVVPTFANTSINMLRTTNK